jgi:transcriptional regulator with PAS, ATPase and Fis domain
MPDGRALMSRLDRQDISDTIVGVSAGLRLVLERVEQFARTDAPVLILGETARAKKSSRALHVGSPRAAGPIVRIDAPQAITSLIPPGEVPRPLR